jgi:hypothetical protein
VGQGGAPTSEAGGMEGDQGGASEGGQVGASEGGLGSAAGGKDATLEHLLRTSAPGLGHGAQEGLTPSLRAFNSWRERGIRRTRRRSNKDKGTREFTQVQPPEG